MKLVKRPLSSLETVDWIKLWQPRRQRREHIVRLEETRTLRCDFSEKASLNLTLKDRENLKRWTTGKGI